MNTVILKVIQKYTYNGITISLENFRCSPLSSNQNGGLHSPARRIGATVVFNTCCEPLPNLTLMPFYLKTQKGVVVNEGAPIEASSKRQESSHVISSHCTVTALECFSLLKKSIFCCLALVRSTVSSRQPTCIHFSCRHTIA